MSSPTSEERAPEFTDEAIALFEARPSAERGQHSNALPAPVGPKPSPLAPPSQLAVHFSVALDYSPQYLATLTVRELAYILDGVANVARAVDRMSGIEANIKERQDRERLEAGK